MGGRLQMERIKQMSLKKSFFTIAALFLLLGVILGAVSFWGCITLQSRFFNAEQLTVDFGTASSPDMQIQYSGATNDWRVTALSVLQIGLPILFVVVSLLIADVVFYRVKLRKPLSVLSASAERIQRQDLDFTIEKYADDELGSLCSAFETMRAELLKNNLELWRQMEERKRLNAAFSHDLRNPVTVIKGGAKLLQKGLEQGALTAENAGDTIALITQYAGRIENYVEAMSSAQKLEELVCAPQPVDWIVFGNELKSSLLILGSDKDKKLAFSFHDVNRQIYVDRSVVQCVAENLVQNALRYAKADVWIDLTCEQEQMTFTVSDDGSGFSQTILQKGATPFLRDDQTSEQKHFGMGLYVCRLLCEKHGGSLTLENTPDGAKTIAAFSISNP
ncbi:MAG: HAMP domain-containing histidine kinase [Ruminococcaceae bacterium]|nr:HAMP domain-containing histidine kinase [Oscillospiraceae bacterium]